MAETSSSTEEQARRVLDLLELPAVNFEPMAITARACPNCGGDRSSVRTPYCSDRCKEIAAFVRQYRAAAAHGRLAEKDRQVALGQKLWRILGGGLPLRRELAPPASWKAVRKRSEGRCEICGEPATDIDHTGSG